MLSWHPARAAGDQGGLALPPDCARVGASTLHRLAGAPAGFSASHFAVQLPPRTGGREAPSLSALVLRVSGKDATVGEAALEQAASAYAAALLIGITGNGYSVCPNDVLQRAGKPIAAGLQQGGGYVANWQALALRGHAGHVTIRTMELRLDAAEGGGADRPVHVALSLDGIAGSLTPPTLLPDHLLVRVTLPASSLPTLLAATGGGAPDAQIPVTVDELRVTEGETVLAGHGTATAAATPMQSTASLHLSARKFDALVERAAVQGLVRLHTTLFLSRLMARNGADGLDWEVDFHDGLLSVNNVPIPLR